MTTIKEKVMKIENEIKENINHCINNISLHRSKEHECGNCISLNSELQAELKGIKETEEEKNREFLEIINKVFSDEALRINDDYLKQKKIKELESN